MEIKTVEKAIKIPDEINHASVQLYLSSYDPEKMQIPREIHSSLLEDLINVYVHYKDLEPLRRLGRYLNRPGDEYFWLYLSEDKELFLAQLNDHLYQVEMAKLEDSKEERKISEKYDTLKDLSAVDLRYRAIDPNYVLLSDKIFISHTHLRRSWGKNFSEVNISLLSGLRIGENLKMIQPRILTLYKSGFEPQGLDYILDKVEKILSIPGVAICGGYPASLLNLSFTDKYKQICMGRDYRTFKRWCFTPRDVDIFLYGEIDIKTTVDRILHVFFPDLRTASRDAIFITEHSINIGRGNNPRFQIIKRKYRTLTHILTGFDLDSSSCAMIMTPEGVISFYGTDRFINAVRYGINVVNPFRQSTTFNYRLFKYSKRGYFPYIAGQMHQRFISVYSGRMFNPEKGRNTFCELLRSRNVFEKRKRVLSDYNADTLNIFRESFNQGKTLRGSNRNLLEAIFKEFKGSVSQENNEEKMSEKFIIFLLERGYPVNVYLNPARIITVNYLYQRWLTRRPGTQATGSFQPTDYNYFGEDPEELFRREIESFRLCPLYDLEVENIIKDYM